MSRPLKRISINHFLWRLRSDKNFSLGVRARLPNGHLSHVRRLNKHDRRASPSRGDSRGIVAKTRRSSREQRIEMEKNALGRAMLVDATKGIE